MPSLLLFPLHPHSRPDKSPPEEDGGQQLSQGQEEDLLGLLIDLACQEITPF